MTTSLALMMDLPDSDTFDYAIHVLFVECIMFSDVERGLDISCGSNRNIN